MKIGICGDIHISKYSSIMRNRGDKYSVKLQNCIASINWFENICKNKNVDMIVYLGDTFDKPDLDAETLTALGDVKWSTNIPHFFIVGNHESPVASLEYNSTEALRKNGFNIISSIHSIKAGTRDIVFIPYIIESDRPSFGSILESHGKSSIVFSHNDLKGIQYGAFKSETGFDINEIQNNCSMFINGHLHNGEWVVPNKIRNLGILTGQNFSEDAFKYKHIITILDSETLTFEDIENPYAINFYNIDISYPGDLNKIFKVKNGVLSIKCIKSLLNGTNTALDAKKADILAYRIILVSDTDNAVQVDDVIELDSEHFIDKWIRFVYENLGKDKIVQEEVDEVCK